MKGAEVAMNGRDILWQADVETLLWTVEIFIIAGEVFMMQVEIFMMTDPEFHKDRWRFSWWQVEILFWTVENFTMTGQKFHGDKSRFYYQQLIIQHFHNERSIYYERLRFS